MTNRPLIEDEKIVLEYIRQYNCENVEEVIISFCGWDDTERRAVIASAVGYLVHNGYVDENKKTKNLTVRIGV